jgi:dTDP-4-dehydrorhamnose 3,5-epimerase
VPNFIFNKTEIDGVVIIEPVIFEDNRGYFMETYNYAEFKAAGIDNIFVQDNQSKSKKGVLRGLHFQKKYPQAKLIRIISGEVFDVAVDIRRNSPTFGKWIGTILSAENKKQIFIPKGFAHGFVVLSDEAEFFYKCDEFYHPEDEDGIIWNDETIGIKWPEVEKIVLGKKDAKNRVFKDEMLNL